MRVVAWGLLLIAATVALGAQREDERQLGEAASVSAASDGDDGGGDDAGAALPPKPLVMKPVDVQGLKIIDEYKGFNQKLVKQEKSLRLQLNSPPEKLKGLAYVPVPGYKYDYQGRTIEDKSRAECELVCSTYSACQSYSYNKQKRTCIWSMSHISYDPAFTMWAKMLTPDGHFHTHMYTKLPGMLVQEKKLPPLKDMTYDECKYECSKDESCKSFSFSDDKTECVKSSVPIHFADGWVYYEKDVPMKKTKKDNHKKENERKKKLRSEWIKASTSSDRHQIEKETKLTEKLEHARLVAEDGERVEKAARREMNYHQKKCVLLSGMAQGSMKRNMHMMGIMSNRQLKAVKLQAESEKMNKAVKQQIRKEGLQKAKLEAKLALLKYDESATKVKDIKGVEHDEKLISKRGKERTVKACDKEKVTQAHFARREAHMKNSEAEAKRLELKKNIAYADKEYRKAAQFAEVKANGERKAKKDVEMQKQLVESAEKRESKAERERDRKVAMDEKESYEMKLHVAETNQRNKKHANMVAMEKLAKAKANRHDLKENGAKTEKVMKEHEKEALKKSDDRKKQKAEEIKKKREVQEQTTKHAAKEKELSKKRVIAQQEGVNNQMDQLEVDEHKVKADTTKREQDEQKVTGQQESGEKADKKRQDALAAVTEQEKETKKKVQEEHTRKENLLQQLKNAQAEANQAAVREKAASEEAARAKAVQQKLADEARKAESESQRAELSAKESDAKRIVVEKSKNADSVQQQKTETALRQQEQADGLKATSCIAVCMEGMHVRHEASQMEKEEKLRQVHAAGSQDASSPVELGAPVELGDGSISLIDIGEGQTCEPQGISASDGGNCGGRLTAQMLSDACTRFQGGGCEGICNQKAETIGSQEASCKTNMKDPAEAQVESAPVPSEDAPPMSDSMRQLYEETEKNRKESKVKADQAKPVPESIPLPRHEPFTYKGCEC